MTDQSVASTISYRDAMFRAQNLTSAPEAIALLQRARANQDHDLIDAIKAEAKHQGWALKADDFKQHSQSINETGAVLQQLRAALAAADAFADPNLTSQARDDARHTMRETAKANARAALQQIATTTADAANRAQAIAEPFRPKLNPDNQAQILRTEQAWRMNVLPQLEAGKPWSTITKNLDEDSALGVERFARSWLVANREPLSNIDIEYSNVVAGIRSRHAEIVANPDARAAILAEDHAAELFHAVNNVASHTAHARTVSDLTMASIALQQVAHLAAPEDSSSE